MTKHRIGACVKGFRVQGFASRGNWRGSPNVKDGNRRPRNIKWTWGFIGRRRVGILRNTGAICIIVTEGPSDTTGSTWACTYLDSETILSESASGNNSFFSEAC